MFIYSIRRKDNLKEIYIGKTNNLRNRIAVHKSKMIKKQDRLLYNWMNEVGYDNLYFQIEEDNISIENIDNKEKEYIKKYEKLEYKMLNEQLTKNYTPLNGGSNESFKDRERLWEMYKDTNLSKITIAKHFGVSSSLVSKIVKEHGGTNRKYKLQDHYEEIQKQIMDGIPIRVLARKYNVRKNSISNINKGITAYNPKLSYPLNEDVRDDIMKRTQFKSKV